MTPLEEIRATYRLIARDPARAADVLAGEGSTGTFVRVEGESASLLERFAISVERLDEIEARDDDTVLAELVVSVPQALVGGDLTTLLASVGGNVSEIAQAQGVRLTGLELPEGFLRASPRPRYGLDGTMALLGNPAGPLRATTVAWSPGNPPATLAERTARILAAGMTVVRDGCPWANPAGCPLDGRIAAIGDVVARHEQETGDRVLFAFSIDDAPDAMVGHADAVRAGGGRAVQLGPAALGLTAIAHVRRHADALLHARSAPQELLARSTALGIADDVGQLLWRLAGLDHLPIPRSAHGAARDHAVDARLRPLLASSDRVMPVVGSRPDIATRSDVLTLDGALVSA